MFPALSDGPGPAFPTALRIPTKLPQQDFWREQRSVGRTLPTTSRSGRPCPSPLIQAMPAALLRVRRRAEDAVSIRLRPAALAR